LSFADAVLVIQAKSKFCQLIPCLHSEADMKQTLEHTSHMCILNTFALSLLHVCFIVYTGHNSKITFSCANVINIIFDNKKYIL